ncbi:hypothetical protein LEN26_004853 [Aphanomyces euteiches]|nr:hypothetical protein AeMF1_017582 [Aphanomyces euteiches]KAH9146961.1 hypothetical protein LEN26_004853 [Aphanomyces euteiches]KAH9182446.1 hypothetical protein AeNC1_015579 [Aphanomyces euteiches]
MHARSVRKKRNDAASLKFCDVQWRFLRSAPTTPTSPSANLMPSSPESILSRGFLHRLETEYTATDADREASSPSRSVLAKLHGKAARDDMLDSLMTELQKTRQEKNQMQHHQRHHDSSHDSSPHIDAIATAKGVAGRVNRRRRSSIYNPEDMAAARANAKAAVQASLEAAHDKGPLVEPSPDRPTTPNIVWRTTDRVHLAQDIPAPLLPIAPSPRVEKVQSKSSGDRKAKYGAWYMPPKDWHKTLGDGAMQATKDEDDVGRSKRQDVAKLFIAREYHKFITTDKDANVPAYLATQKGGQQQPG